MKKVLLSILFVGVATLANAQKSEIAEAKRLWGIFQFSMMVDPNTSKTSASKPAANTQNKDKTPAATGSFIDKQIASLKEAMVHADNAIAHEKTKGLAEPYVYKALFASTIALVDTLNDENSSKYQKEAEAAIAKAESLSPKGDEVENISSAKVNVRNAINGRAVRAYKRQDYAAAMSGFNQLIAINPQDTAMYINLGVTAKLMGNYKDAANYFKKVISFNTPEAKTFYQETVAMTLNDLKDTTATLALTKEALAKYPDDPYFIGVETDIYITKGDIAKSQELLGKLIAKDPKKAVYHYLYGDTYYKQAFALQAVRDKIDSKKVKEYEAVGAKMMGLIDQAIPHYKKALELDPKFASALDTMVRIYAFKGDTKSYEEYKKRLDAVATN